MKRRALSIIVALALLQALLLALWWGVERGRGPAWETAAKAQWTEGLALQAPAIVVERPDGTGVTLPSGDGRPLTLHFWATWCPPCREELPALLKHAESTGYEIAAISVDEGWGPVKDMLGPRLPPALVIADPARVAEAFDISTLPVTLRVDGAGVIRVRVDGPVDWGSAADIKRLKGSDGGPE